MKNNQYARIGKITPLKLYKERSEMKDLSKAGTDHLAKQAETSMKY